MRLFEQTKHNSILQTDFWIFEFVAFKHLIETKRKDRVNSHIFFIIYLYK